MFCFGVFLRVYVCVLLMLFLTRLIDICSYSPFPQWLSCSSLASVTLKPKVRYSAAVICSQSSSGKVVWNALQLLPGGWSKVSACHTEVRAAESEHASAEGLQSLFLPVLSFTRSLFHHFPLFPLSPTHVLFWIMPVWYVHRFCIICHWIWLCIVHTYTHRRNMWTPFLAHTVVRSSPILCAAFVNYDLCYTFTHTHTHTHTSSAKIHS